ncbi:hypothetical protein DICVIV_01176 [Dictyocaulus viviparus]|uniref:Methyltransferase domain-containing protein n=1 Tax=Dictyocaulus viviparus TaxID=29172 RepID=A0A0D8YDA2_DICVI|nr:hypothetical protein DICVIV_01176 [Dictyocaulus viviparus]
MFKIELLPPEKGRHSTHTLAILQREYELFRTFLTNNKSTGKEAMSINAISQSRSLLWKAVRCPNLVRVGYVGDGGHYVCNPKAFPIKHCSIYSIGLHNEISFDIDIQQLSEFRCNLYGYDSALSMMMILFEK